MRTPALTCCLCVALGVGAVTPANAQYDETSRIDYYRSLIGDGDLDDRRSGLVHRNLGILFDRMGKFHTGYPHLKKAVEYDPSFENHVALGVSYIGQSNRDKARSTLESSLALDHDAAGEARAHYLLGQVAYYDGRMQAARTHLSRAVELDDDTFHVLWHLIAADATHLDAGLRASLDTETWPGPLVALWLDELTPKALLSRVGELPPHEQPGAETEARFYIGKIHQRTGRQSRARREFRKIESLGATGFIENIYARWELER